MIKLLAAHCTAAGNGGPHCYGSNLSIGIIGIAILVVIGIFTLLGKW